MKKIILTGSLAFAMLFSTSVNAQNSDKQYTPQAGDWGVGISANPILNYFGNFFGKTANNNAPTWNNLTQDNQIIGRYFLQDNMAIRARLRLGFYGDKEKNMVMDRTIDQTGLTFPNLPKKVENDWKHSDYNVAIAGGLEWRTGSKRLQLLYGAELGFGFAGSSDKYTYGNALNPNAKIPVVVTSDDNMNGGANVNPTSAVYGANGRTISDKYGKEFLVGLRGFFGVEFFVAPKISLAGEFGWGIVYNTGGKETLNYESIGVKKGASKPSVETIEETGNVKNNGFGADQALNNQLFGAAGTLSVNFYF